MTNNVHLSSERVNAAGGARAYLKMVPVEVYGPKGKARILALLDEGSTVTLLDSAVADEVGLSGPKDALSLETVGGKIIRKDDSMRVNISLRGLQQTQRSGARTIDELRLTPQRIGQKKIRRVFSLT